MGTSKTRDVSSEKARRYEKANSENKPCRVPNEKPTLSRWWRGLARISTVNFTPPYVPNNCQRQARSDRVRASLEIISNFISPFVSRGVASYMCVCVYIYVCVIRNSFKSNHEENVPRGSTGLGFSTRFTGPTKISRYSAFLEPWSR